MEKKIGAIESGVNIDHIPQGQAMNILRTLKLKRKYPVGVGMNLSSKRLGIKDLVKIENYYLSAKELELISIFAPGATYSEIKDYKVIRKITIPLAGEMRDLIMCPNLRCISRDYNSHFKINEADGKNIVYCKYCEHSYPLSQITEFNFKRV